MRVRRALAALAVVGLFASGCSTPGTRLGGPVRWDPKPNVCPRPTSAPTSLTPSAAGLDTRGVPRPAWVGRLGSPVVAGEMVVGGRGGCLVGVLVDSGTQRWSSTVPGSSAVTATSAGDGIVLISLSDVLNPGAAEILPVVDRLVALDPSTGRQQWSLALPEGDGQGMPAIISGDTVIVTEADGSVVGLDVRSGRTRWRDTPPSGCDLSGDNGADDEVGATVFAGLRADVVVFQCPDGARVTGLDARSGTMRWTRTLPSSVSVDWQKSSAVADDVVAFVVQGRGADRLAPVRITTAARPPGRGDISVLALRASTGAPVWEVDRVVNSAAVYGDAGRLCVLSGLGVGCYLARTGAAAWRWAAPVAMGGSEGLPAVTDAGRLSVTAPTPAVRSIPRESTTYRSPSGTFLLRTFDIRTGRSVAVTPLPAYYGGTGGVVTSATTPPGVVSAGAGTVLVSPQLEETAAVEAYRTPR